MYSERGLDFIPISLNELKKKKELYFLFNFFLNHFKTHSRLPGTITCLMVLFV